MTLASRMTGKLVYRQRLSAVHNCIVRQAMANIAKTFLETDRTLESLCRWIANLSDARALVMDRSCVVPGGPVNQAARVASWQAYFSGQKDASFL